MSVNGMAMFNLFVSVIAGLILSYVTFFDFKEGRFHLPRKVANRPQRYLYRSETPFLFYFMLLLRGLAVVLLVMIITGWLFQLIEMTI